MNFLLFGQGSDPSNTSLFNISKADGQEKNNTREFKNQMSKIIRIIPEIMFSVLHMNVRNLFFSPYT